MATISSSVQKGSSIDESQRALYLESVPDRSARVWSFRRVYLLYQFGHGPCKDISRIDMTTESHEQSIATPW